MIDKILVAINSSPQSQSVFNTALFLAQATNASMTLLHILSEQDPNYPVLSTGTYYSAFKGDNNGILQEKFDEYEQREAEFLRNLASKAIAVGVDAEYAQLSGIPGRDVCQIADAWSADLIVVGNRGLKGLQEMFVGSVSNYITHNAPCSVLIVRSDTDLISDSVEFTRLKKDL